LEGPTVLDDHLNSATSPAGPVGTRGLTKTVRHQPGHGRVVSLVCVPPPVPRWNRSIGRRSCTHVLHSSSVSQELGVYWVSTLKIHGDLPSHRAPAYPLTAFDGAWTPVYARRCWPWSRGGRTGAPADGGSARTRSPDRPSQAGEFKVTRCRLHRCRKPRPTGRQDMTRSSVVEPAFRVAAIPRRPARDNAR